MSSREVNTIIDELVGLKNSTRAHELQRFFQTLPGQYGEGDIFLGLTVPQVRAVAGNHKKIELQEIENLLKSDYHEVRFCGLVILTEQFKRSSDLGFRKKIFNFYVKSIRDGSVNNWDLVDIPGSSIGEYLLTLDEPLDILVKYSRSRNLWMRRASVIFTFPFIRSGEVLPTLTVSELLLQDKHDLIQEAVGWSLREVGKRDLLALKSFLNENSTVMPRTMLRYSIEKLPQSERKYWLNKRI